MYLLSPYCLSASYTNSIGSRIPACTVFACPLASECGRCVAMFDCFHVASLVVVCTVATSCVCTVATSCALCVDDARGSTHHRLCDQHDIQSRATTAWRLSCPWALCLFSCLCNVSCVNSRSCASSRRRPPTSDSCTDVSHRCLTASTSSSRLQDCPRGALRIAPTAATRCVCNPECDSYASRFSVLPSCCHMYDEELFCISKHVSREWRIATVRRSSLHCTHVVAISIALPVFLPAQARSSHHSRHSCEDALSRITPLSRLLPCFPRCHHPRAHSYITPSATLPVIKWSRRLVI